VRKRWPVSVSSGGIVSYEAALNEDWGDGINFDEMGQEEMLTHDGYRPCLLLREGGGIAVVVTTACKPTGLKTATPVMMMLANRREGKKGGESTKITCRSEGG
jgi:hypothetical protein